MSLSPSYRVDRRLDPLVSTTELADNSVTLAKMADDSVGAAEIVAGGVTQIEAPTLLRLFDRVTPGLSGNPPLASVGGFLLQAGTSVSGGASPFSITFPTPFPNGLVTVWACFGDSPGASAYYTKNSGVNGFDFFSGAAIPHRVNWVALGW